MSVEYFEQHRREMVAAIKVIAEHLAAEVGKTALEDRVLKALAKVPRHEFVPVEVRPYAYLMDRPSKGAVVDLAVLLGSLGLEQYETVFRENEIDESVLPDLTEDHLRELGFPLGARLKILKAIGTLHADRASALPTDATLIGLLFGQWGMGTWSFSSKCALHAVASAIT